jgi:hypothetical protein
VNSSPGIVDVPPPYRVPRGAFPGYVFVLALTCILRWSFPAQAADAKDTNALVGMDFFRDSSTLKGHQIITLGVPPASPADFNPDSGVAPTSTTNLFTKPELTLQLVRMTNHSRVLAPPAFNPDPGAAFITNTPEPGPYFTNEIKLLPDRYDGDPIPPNLQLPRDDVVTRRFVPVDPTNAPPPYGSEPLDKKLQLPRKDARKNEPIAYKWEYENYPLAMKGIGYPTNAVPEPDRWRIGFVPWQRYTTGSTETPYESPTTMLWRPYQQSLLKGDSPIIGQDIFLDLTAESETDFEAKSIPTPSGITAASPDAAEFYGRSSQLSVANYFSFSLDLFKGDTSFQPVHWAVHIQPVYNVNYVQAHETGVVSADPRGFGATNGPPPNNNGITEPGQVPPFLNTNLTGGPANLSGTAATTRTRQYFALQEAFFELHLGDLSENYDFAALRVGNQVFNQDFRGFLFNDVNTALRLFGNYDNNQYQYNLAVFDMREKDTDSGLNSFNSREQQIVLANLYRQDAIWHGYTAQVSVLANFDSGGGYYDENGNLVRPEPLGTIREHSVQAYYLGWAGDGHIGRLNITHQFYQALGHDNFNGLAGHEVSINAQMAALELSYDEDWIRYKASVFYASGDKDATDGHATGFDTVVDNPNFTGGPFSYWVRQGFNLGGTAVGLKQPNSLVPDLRSSKSEGQANFVNPGAFIISLGTEMDLTPKSRLFLNANYIRFVDTDSLKTALLTDQIDDEVGWDLSIGMQYRPLLTDNIIVSAGLGVLIPGQGYKDIYKSNTSVPPGFGATGNPGHVDDFLYSGVIAVTFTY